MSDIPTEELGAQWRELRKQTSDARTAVLEAIAKDHNHEVHDLYIHETPNSYCAKSPVKVHVEYGNFEDEPCLCIFCGANVE